MYNTEIYWEYMEIQWDIIGYNGIYTHTIIINTMFLYMGVFVGGIRGNLIYSIGEFMARWDNPNGMRNVVGYEFVGTILHPLVNTLWKFVT